MKSFDYYDAKSVDEAIDLLQQFKGEATLLAGGTDILVKAKHNAFNPKVVIDISKIKTIKEIVLNGNIIRIGAGVKLYEIVNSEIINRHAKILADAAEMVGSVQVRNMATIGGNVGNAAPSADTITPLLVLKADAVIIGPEGESKIPVAELFKGPGLTVLGPYQMIKEFLVPCVPEKTGMIYIKHARRKAMDVATVGCAARIGINQKDKTVKDAYIALGAVAPTAVLLKGVAEKLIGKMPDAEICKELGKLALSQVSPISDIRSTKEYRSYIVNHLVKEAIMKAYESAIG